jgi:hypothetical protein
VFLPRVFPLPLDTRTVAVPRERESVGRAAPIALLWDWVTAEFVSLPKEEGGTDRPVLRGTAGVEY